MYMGERRISVGHKDARLEPGDPRPTRPTTLAASARRQRRATGPGATWLAAASGFTLIEVMLVLGIATVLVGAAIPSIITARERMELSGATHDIASAVQTARMRAVSTGVTMRIRFNCPAAGQYRIVEVVGTSGIDGATNRCDPAVYPYPDLDAANRPNNDGPVQVLRGGTTFSQVVNLDIAPSGRITPASGSMPVSIVITKGNATQTVTLSAAGRVAFQ